MQPVLRLPRNLFRLFRDALLSSAESTPDAWWTTIAHAASTTIRRSVWCRQDRPTPNGARLPIHKERRASAGKFGSIGWHTFRHTYRSWLDETGAPMKVQQELMRHASIQTTMNVYGQAMATSKREANGKVVEMVLKPLKASA
jgi:integrase